MSGPGKPMAELTPKYLAEDNSAGVVAATTVIVVVSTILFPLRLYGRKLKGIPVHFEEALLYPAYFALLALATVFYLCVYKYGLGKHVEAVDPSMITGDLLMLYCECVIYFFVATLPRLSIALLYLRIFRVERKLKVAYWTLIAVLLAWGVAGFYAAVFQCYPPSYTWDKTIEGKCGNQVLGYAILNMPNPLIDMAFLILPIRRIWIMQSSVARRIGVICICAVGSIGIIASVVRTVLFFTLDKCLSTDPTFCTELAILTIVEPGMYFCGACLIGVRPVVQLVVDKFKNRGPQRHGGARHTQSTTAIPLIRMAPTAYYPDSSANSVNTVYAANSGYSVNTVGYSATSVVTAEKPEIKATEVSGWV